MKKNILVVVGSPRSNGNTEILCDAFIEGAESSGHTVKKINLNKLKINGCVDCKYCFSHNGECAQKDDMQEVYKALDETDMIVLGTPVYFCDFTAQMKSMIDRLFAYSNKKLKATASALLTAYADEGTAACEPLIVNYKALTHHFNWNDEGIVAASGVFNKGDIEKHKAIDEARQLGQKIK